MGSGYFCSLIAYKKEPYLCKTSYFFFPPASIHLFNLHCSISSKPVCRNGADGEQKVLYSPRKIPGKVINDLEGPTFHPGSHHTNRRDEE